MVPWISLLSAALNHCFTAFPVLTDGQFRRIYTPMGTLFLKWYRETTVLLTVFTVLMVLVSRGPTGPRSIGYEWSRITVLTVLGTIFDGINGKGFLVPVVIPVEN